MHFSLLRSKEELLGLSDRIEAFIRANLTPSDLTHTPAYFLGRLERLMQPRVVVGWENHAIAGIFYASERTVAGIPTGWCFGGDDMGRGLIVTRPGEEDAFLAGAGACLFDAGIHAFRLRRRREQGEDTSLPPFPTVPMRSLTCMEVRSEGDWLRLDDTYEGFLARLGLQTRRNMRRYRRKAESHGIRFVSQLSVTERNLAFERLRHTADYQYSRIMSERDHQFFQFIDHPVVAALRASNGDCVAMVAGARFGDGLHLFNQINDSSLRSISISLVLRSYLIEWAIAQGIRSIHFMNGTSPMLGRYCAPVHVQHITLDWRRSLAHPLKLSGAHWARSLQRNGKWVPMRLRTVVGSYLAPEFPPTPKPGSGSAH